MAKKTTKKKDNSKKAGLIAFGTTLITYALLFPFHKLGHFIIGGALASLAGWVVKTMATPMKGLDKNAKSKAALDVTIIEDDYARGVVEKGVEMLDALKTERDAINEYVFTRRIDELRANLDKVLRNIIDDQSDAPQLRKMNSYYLPTALKLLQSYRTAKQQGTSYHTMAETREDVLSTLDKLNEALIHVHEKMLENDLESMDIEIDVFERMLKSDGLNEDEVTDSLRRSAHAAAKNIPMSKAPTVKPTAPVQPKPVQKAAPKPATQSVHKPEAVTLDYEVQAKESESTPVPVLEVPAATASARTLQQGAPVLNVPTASAAHDLPQSNQREENR